MRVMIVSMAALTVVLTPLSVAFGQEAVTAPSPAPSAPTATRASPPKAVVAKAAKDDDKIICRSIRHTGTRFPERVCRTRRQIKLAEEGARDQTERLQERDASIIRRPVSVGN